MPSLRPQSIPVLLLVRTAFQLLWQQRDDVLRLGLAPALLCFGGVLFGREDLQALVDTMNLLATSPAGGSPYDALPADVLSGIMVMFGILLLGYCLMTVNWLRFVLLGPMAAIGLGLTIGRPHWAYLLAFTGLLLAGGFAAMVASMPVSLLPGILGQIAVIAIFVVGLVTGARFIPFLVAIAVGQRISLQQSWVTSRGNGVPLITALVLAWAPFMVAAFAVNGLLEAIGFATAAPAAKLFIMALIEAASWVAQAGVLATAYRHMVGIRV